MNTSRDPLGRPWRYDPDPEPRGFRMLSEDALATIAHEARTKPLAEVGRHVFPLLHHIAASDDRICQSCRHWVAYNQAESTAPNGECLVHAADGSRIEVQAIVEDGGSGAHGVVLVVTPFDWSCAGWEQRQTASDDAQCQKG